MPVAARVVTVNVTDKPTEFIKADKTDNTATNKEAGTTLFIHLTNKLFRALVDGFVCFRFKIIHLKLYV